MNNVALALDGAWRVALASLLLGAGLPAIFALGVRALAAGADATSGTSQHRSRWAGTMLAVALFAIVLLVVALGLLYIVASGMGKTLSFQHVWPTLVEKG